MNEDLEIKLNRKLVFEESTEEIRDLTTKQFATTEELANNEYVYTSTIDKNECRRAEAQEISIDEIKKLIAKAEEAGANFIAIDYHCDHGEYDICGFHLERASTVDLKELNDTIAKELERKKAQQIAHYEAKLKELKG